MLTVDWKWCFCSGQIECDEPIDALSYKLGIYRVGAGGRESRTVFERMSYNGKTSIVKCMWCVLAIFLASVCYVQVTAGFLRASVYSFSLLLRHPKGGHYILSLLFLSLFLVPFLLAALGARWLELNQTLPHVSKWARFANWHTKFAVPLP